MDPGPSVCILPFNLYLLPYIEYYSTTVYSREEGKILSSKIAGICQGVRNAGRKYAKNSHFKAPIRIASIIQFKLLNLNRLTFAY